MPRPAPPGWRALALPGGSVTLHYPPAWRPIQSDPGTVSAALRSGSVFHGYLNVTPKQGAESLHGWATFRLNHQREENRSAPRQVAAAEGLPFRSATGSCVIDDYSTRLVMHRYREIACLVAGARRTDVLIAAAPVAEWSQRGAELERAVAAFNG